MTRCVPIIEEGVPTNDGRLIPVGALTWPRLPLPVVLGGDFPAMIYGNVVAVVRDGTTIKATVDFDVLDGLIVSPSVADTTVVFDDATGISTFTRCTLAGATLIPAWLACWEWPR